MLKLLPLIMLLSCSVTWKKDRPENAEERKLSLAEIKEQERLKRLEDQTKWQHHYYEQVIFKVKNPILADTKAKIDGICNGDEFEFSESYQYKPLSFVKFKKTPIGIRTKSGFSKKIFITKGACRELLLHKTGSGDSKQIRTSIKEMNILYVYNVGSYLIDTTFGTKFSDVDFYVR